jgi:hypothetical protein
VVIFIEDFTANICGRKAHQLQVIQGPPCVAKKAFPRVLINTLSKYQWLNCVFLCDFHFEL